MGELSDLFSELSLSAEETNAMESNTQAEKNIMALLRFMVAF
jgi:hypothetical protein